MKRIAVLTSGGDAPGMNACIRAVVRTAIYNKLEVIGIRRGYQGMIEGDFMPMDSHSVSNIIQRGGTILKSARSEAFRTEKGRKTAYEQLKKAGVEGLVVIGGDGSFSGAWQFYKEFEIPAVGCPGTIDNDLYGTDLTIGYDTAVNTVVEAVDRIRDTATSHDRLFFVEVMGRDAGFIALRSGIAVGAEAVLIPETETHIEALIELLKKGWQRKKSSAIIIVAEGDDAGGAFDVARKVQQQFDCYDTRVTVLGHLQRGGAPTATDRVLASQVGQAAVMALLEGKHTVMVGQQNNEMVFTPFEQATKYHNKVNPQLLELTQILAT